MYFKTCFRDITTTNTTMYDDVKVGKSVVKSMFDEASGVKLNPNISGVNPLSFWQCAIPAQTYTKVYTKQLHNKIRYDIDWWTNFDKVDHMWRGNAEIVNEIGKGIKLWFSYIPPTNDPEIILYGLMNHSVFNTYPSYYPDKGWANHKLYFWNDINNNINIVYYVNFRLVLKASYTNAVFKKLRLRFWFPVGFDSLNHPSARIDNFVVRGITDEKMKWLESLGLEAV